MRLNAQSKAWPSQWALSQEEAEGHVLTLDVTRFASLVKQLGPYDVRQNKDVVFTQTGWVMDASSITEEALPMLLEELVEDFVKERLRLVLIKPHFVGTSSEEGEEDSQKVLVLRTRVAEPTPCEASLDVTVAMAETSLEIAGLKKVDINLNLAPELLAANTRPPMINIIINVVNSDVKLDVSPSQFPVEVNHNIWTLGVNEPAKAASQLLSNRQYSIVVKQPSTSLLQQLEDQANAKVVLTGKPSGSCESTQERA